MMPWFIFSRAFLRGVRADWCNQEYSDMLVGIGLLAVIAIVEIALFPIVLIIRGAVKIEELCRG